jgi:hypothetical protein
MSISQLQAKMSPDTRENITSYKGKYHKLQVKMSPVIREMSSVIGGNIISFRENLCKIFMK